MRTFENDTPIAAPDARDFLGGNYLKKEDLDGPTVATVEEVWSEAVLGASRRKLVVSFREFEKPLILNKTNIKRLANVFGTSNTSSWRGRITLYVENNVEYGGRVVGGIRVRPAEAKAESRGESPDNQSYANGYRAKESFEVEADIF